MNSKKYLEYIQSQDLYNFKDKKNNIYNHTLYMLLRTGSMFKWSGLPDTIPECFLELYLQVNGFACIAKDPGNDKVYAFYGGLGGEPDPYYQPTKCVVANPALNLSKEYIINEDCVIIRNDKFFHGLLPLFNKYASMLAENELSMNMASINTRIQQAISAGDDKAKESAELFLKKLIEGDIAVLADNAFLDSDTIKTLPFSNTSSSGVIGDLIEYEQYLKASWYNEIGLNANYNMKREALNSAESNINNDILFPLTDEMLKMRKDGCRKVNEMFGLDIDVELNSSWADNKEEEKAEIIEMSGPDEETGNDENTEDGPEETEDAVTEEIEDSGESTEDENTDAAKSDEIEEPDTETIEEVQETVEEIKEDVEEIKDEIKDNEENEVKEDE